MKKLIAGCSAVVYFLCLLCTNGYTQTGFGKVDDWLQHNAGQMGGRVILMIYKDGKLLHTNAVNDISRKKMAVGKFIARCQDKAPDTMPFGSDRVSLLQVAANGSAQHW